MVRLDMAQEFEESLRNARNNDDSLQGVLEGAGAAHAELNRLADAEVVYGKLTNPYERVHFSIVVLMGLESKRRTIR